MQLKDFLKIESRGRGSLKALAIELNVSEDRVSRWCRNGSDIDWHGVITSKVWRRILIGKAVALSAEERDLISSSFNQQ